MELPKLSEDVPENIGGEMCARIVMGVIMLDDLWISNSLSGNETGNGSNGALHLVAVLPVE